jgi:hypothetical protein
VHQQFALALPLKGSGSSMMKMMHRQPRWFQSLGEHGPRGWDLARYGRSPEGPGMYLVNAKGEPVPHWSPEAPRYIRTLAKPYATHARAQMNHYMLRSAETFSLKAGTRAPVSLTDRYTDAYRARADKGNEPDMSAFHYADAFTALHTKAMALPDVARLHLLCCADHLRLIAEKHGRRVEEDARWHDYIARAKALEAGSGGG